MTYACFFMDSGGWSWMDTSSDTEVKVQFPMLPSCWACWLLLISLCRLTGPVPAFREDLQSAGEGFPASCLPAGILLFCACFLCVLSSFLTHRQENWGSWQRGDLSKGKQLRCEIKMIILWFCVQQVHYTYFLSYTYYCFKGRTLILLAYINCTK